jgi:hypothetical protein
MYTTTVGDKFVKTSALLPNPISVDALEVLGETVTPRV